MRVAIRGSLDIDVPAILGLVDLVVTETEARKRIRSEVHSLVAAWCSDSQHCPPRSVEYLAFRLCRDGAAKPRPNLLRSISLADREMIEE